MNGSTEFPLRKMLQRPMFRPEPKKRAIERTKARRALWLLPVTTVCLWLFPLPWLTLLLSIGVGFTSGLMLAPAVYALSLAALTLNALAGFWIIDLAGERDVGPFVSFLLTSSTVAVFVFFAGDRWLRTKAREGHSMASALIGGNEH